MKSMKGVEREFSYVRRWRRRWSRKKGNSFTLAHMPTYIIKSYNENKFHQKWTMEKKFPKNAQHNRFFFLVSWARWCWWFHRRSFFRCLWRKKSNYNMTEYWTSWVHTTWLMNEMFHNEKNCSHSRWCSSGRLMMMSLRVWVTYLWRLLRLLAQFTRWS